MGDADLQAVMTGLQEVLPVLEQAQDVLQDDGGLKRAPDSKGWSSTWSGKPKARPPLFQMYAASCVEPKLKHIPVRLGPHACTCILPHLATSGSLCGPEELCHFSCWQCNVTRDTTSGTMHDALAAAEKGRTEMVLSESTQKIQKAMPC